MGVEEALFSLTKDLHDAADRGKKSILILLDMAKAFDSIDRLQLAESLEANGISGGELRWFGSFLENRQQVVTVNDVSSKKAPVDYGVIQGSTLGPLLFLIYIDKIGKLPLKGKVYMFADDTAVLCQGGEWDEVFSTANSDMDLLYTWLCSHTLSLNVDKTKYLVFSKSIVKDTASQEIRLHSFCKNDGSSSCACPRLERVTSARYLGVVIDENLKWEQHIASLTKKLLKFNYVFYKLRPCLNQTSLIRVYKSIVQCIISFGIIVWGGTYPTTIKPLIVSHKSILKVVARKSRRFPSSQIFREVPVFSLSQLYIKSSLMFYHKHPEMFKYPSRSGIRDIRPSTQAVLPAPRTRLKCTSRHIYYSLPLLLRTLPENLVNSNSTSRTKFKKEVFSWLIVKGANACENLFSSIYAV